MLSRVANSIYWMSRYLERADNISRFIQVNSHLIMDLGLERASSRWLPLVYATGDHEDFEARYASATEKHVLHFLTFDRENINSILSCVETARENARTIRENIPPEMWGAINELYHVVKKHSRKRHIDDLHGFYEQVQHINQLVMSYAEHMMVHGEAWHFARMGRMLERADKTARLLDIKYFFLTSSNAQANLAYDAVEWGAVLNSVNATDMYRKKHHLFSYRNIVDFLIFDRTVPRSVAFCIHAAEHSLQEIVGTDVQVVPSQEQMAILCSSLESTNVDQVLASGIHEFIDIFQYNLNVVDESIYQSFFAVLV